jgi:hypothetical protein
MPRTLACARVRSQPQSYGTPSASGFASGSTLPLAFVSR